MPRSTTGLMLELHEMHEPGAWGAVVYRVNFEGPVVMTASSKVLRSVELVVGPHCIPY
jgi:hypothetical protein